MVSRRNLSVCVLILSVGSGGKGEPEKMDRWRSEKEIWRRYMHTHPSVTCRFIECGTGHEGDTIFCACKEDTNTQTDLWKKTSLAASQVDINAYDYFVRPNLNMFLVFDYLFDYFNSFPYDPTLHTGGSTLGGTYPSGSCMIYGRDCASALAQRSFLSNVCSTFEDICIAQFLENAGFPMKEQDPSIWYMWDESKTRDEQMQTIDKQRHPFVRTKEVANQREIQNSLVDRYYPSALPSNAKC